MKRAKRETDRCADAHLLRRELERCAERRKQRIAERCDIVRSGVGDQDGEFIACQPPDERFLGCPRRSCGFGRHHRAQTVGELGEQLIALCMAERVVDRLEMIEVDEGKHRAALRAQPPKHPIGLTPEMHAIGKARDRIEHGKPVCGVEAGAHLVEHRIERVAEFGKCVVNHARSRCGKIALRRRDDTCRSTVDGTSQPGERMFRRRPRHDAADQRDDDRARDRSRFGCAIGGGEHGENERGGPDAKGECDSSRLERDPFHRRAREPPIYRTARIGVRLASAMRRKRLKFLWASMRSATQNDIDRARAAMPTMSRTDGRNAPSDGAGRQPVGDGSANDSTQRLVEA